MEKEKDTDAKNNIDIIAEGVEQGLANSLYHMSLVILGFTILFIIFAVAADKYETYQYENNPDYGRLESVTSMRQNSDLEYLSCRVIIGNETEQWDSWTFHIYGYAEANAKYEMMYPEVERWLIEENLTFEIFGLECE